jgi:hypothetical protein
VVSCPRPVLRRLLLRAGRIPAHFLRQQQQLIHLRLLERLVLLLVRLLVLLLGCLERLVLLFLLLERLLVVLYLAGASVKSTLADQLLLLLLHPFLDASVKCTAADQLLLRCPLRSLVALFASSLYRSCRATT